MKAWLLLAALPLYGQALPEVRVSAIPYVPAGATLRVESDLVEVGVVVRGHDGRVISGLQRTDFYIQDQGAKREISTFVVETAPGANANAKKSSNAAGPVNSTAALVVSAPAERPPRFIALHFDDFSTGAANLHQAQTAALRFVNEVLTANDRAALFSTSGRMLLDFTADKAKLTDAISKLRPHSRFSDAGLTACPRITPYQAYLIAIELDPAAERAAVDEAAACQSNDPGSTAYRPQNRAQDATVQMVKGQAEQIWAQARITSQETLASIGGTLNTLAGKPGQRILLLVSAGFICGTLEQERDRLLNQALHSGIVINALDAKGLDATGPGRPFNDPGMPTVPLSTFQFETSSLGDKLATANQAMSDLAQGTGGLFFHNNNDLTAGFQQLGAVPEVTYMLGFHRGSDAADGSFHKLKVGFNAPNPYVIEARAGYFAAPPQRSPGEEARRQLDGEVLAASFLQQFPAQVTYQLISSTVKVKVHMDISKLRFPIRDDRRLQQFRVITALLDEKGNLLTGKEGTLALALGAETYARLLTNGIDAKLNLEAAAPGKNRLRAVVQEEVDGKMASSTQVVEVK